MGERNADQMMCERYAILLATENKYGIIIAEWIRYGIHEDVVCIVCLWLMYYNFIEHLKTKYF